jgi:predicted SAM-dependent methyltransferase
MKLHIGCGKKYLPGYKHIDAIDAEHIDFVCDTRQLNMIADESVSELYACHVLEHVKRDHVMGVLREWQRVLKPGAEIRIAVPDFEAIVAEYVETNEINSLQGLLYGGQDYEYNFHYVAFDFAMIEALLTESGLCEVQRYDWREFLPDGYDDFSRAYIPHMDFKNGRLMSLNVKATKK